MKKQSVSTYLTGKLMIPVALLITVTLAAAAILYHFRSSPSVWVFRNTVFGDRALSSTIDSFHAKFVPQQTVYFESSNKEDEIIPSWAFRPSHAVPTYPIPVVGDLNRDGKPEVYIGSYSKELYALDGKTGNSLWEWKLPFGVIGGRAVELGDVDGDGIEEIIFASHTSLPIRIYALKGGEQKNENRLLWTANLSGQFVEGGLTFYKNPSDGSPLIVAATRDALYSRGTFNVINGDGSQAFTPYEGLDVCANRPAIGILPFSREPVVIHGSHDFYHVANANRIVARSLQTGEIYWVSPVIGDTGFQNHQIVDVDFDGRNEVIAVAQDKNTKKSRIYVLDGLTGAVVKESPWYVQKVFADSKNLLVAQDKETLRLAADGTVLYRIPQVSFSIMNRENQTLLFNVAYQENKLTINCYRASDGVLIKEYSSKLELPAYKNPEDYGVLGEPTSQASFCTLADTDNDGRWDVLIQIRDFIVNVKMPLEVTSDSNPLSPIPFRNKDNSGISSEKSTFTQTSNN